ncbi:transposase domain-containing protein [Photobacterium marinum]
MEQFLLATDKVSIRRRRLPALQAVWLVIFMG